MPNIEILGLNIQISKGLSVWYLPTVAVDLTIELCHLLAVLGSKAIMCIVSKVQ